MKSYYGELCTKVYEQQKSLADLSEVSFYLSFVQHKADKVLEPMCGNGRMLIPFLQAGIDIEGFDLSEDMLAVCRQKAHLLGYSANVFHAKIEEYKPSDKFDLIIIPFGSLSLLTDEMIEQAITNMKQSLKENGRMVLTIMLKPDTLALNTDWVKTDEVHIDDETIVLYKQVSYDPLLSMQYTSLKYVSRHADLEQIELMDFPMRLFDESEFIILLNKQGITKIHKHIAHNGYGEGNHFYAYECKK